MNAGSDIFIYQLSDYSGGLHDLTDDHDEPLPVRFFNLKLFSTRSRELIEAARRLFSDVPHSLSIQPRSSKR